MEADDAIIPIVWPLTPEELVGGSTVEFKRLIANFTEEEKKHFRQLRRTAKNRVRTHSNNSC